MNVRWAWGDVMGTVVVANLDEVGDKGALSDCSLGRMADGVHGVTAAMKIT